MSARDREVMFEAITSLSQVGLVAVSASTGGMIRLELAGCQFRWGDNKLTPVEVDDVTPSDALVSLYGRVTALPADACVVDQNGRHLRYSQPIGWEVVGDESRDGGQTCLS